MHEFMDGLDQAKGVQISGSKVHLGAIHNESAAWYSNMQDA